MCIRDSLLTAFGLVVFQVSTQTVSGTNPARTAQSAPSDFERAKHDALPSLSQQGR